MLKMSGLSGIIFEIIVVLLILFIYDSCTEKSYISEKKITDFSIPGEELETNEESNPTEDIIKPHDPISEKTKAIETEILRITNLRRRENNVPELKSDSKLSDIARDHSFDMFKNDFFDHVSLAGQDPTDRAKKVGYPTTKKISDGYYQEGIGENIGQMGSGHIANPGVGYVEDTPQGIAEAQMIVWMNSPGHRKNILDPNYDYLGVGVVQTDYDYILTQDFK